MKLIKKIYRDEYRNEWVVENHKLPKKRGDWNYWTAECGRRAFRADTQKELFDLIKKSNDEINRSQLAIP